MKERSAVITGVTGQDGAFLARYLINRGYEVYGGVRRSSERKGWRLRELGIADDVEFKYCDLHELTNVARVLKRVQPNELYNLGAQSFVGVSFEQPILTAEVNGLGAMRVLEIIREYSPHTKFYQASTSEMFGNAEGRGGERCGLDSCFEPASPYACSKVLAHHITNNYRRAHDIYAVAGVLFNHESPLRGREFVTRKIARGVASIVKNDEQGPLVLGNLDAERDWGYAGDYVKAMWMMLQQERPRNYVIGTGRSHSVRRFVEEAFKCVDQPIRWEGTDLEERGIDPKSGRVLVEVSEEFFRPEDVGCLKADAHEAERELGWTPQMSFAELVEVMVDAEIKRLEGE